MPIYRFEDLKDVHQNPDLSTGHGDQSQTPHSRSFCDRVSQLEGPRCRVRTAAYSPHTHRTGLRATVIT